MSLLMLAAISAVVLVWMLGRRGSTTIESWIGDEVARIANGYLNPQLSFTDLDYQYPLTVRLKHFRLSAPNGPGKTIDVLAADEATVTLAEIPHIGQPIRIQNVVLQKPVIRAVATRAGSKEFIGLSHVVRESATTQPSSAQTRKLSDDFQIRLLELVDGQIVYDPRIPGTRPMELDHINTKLTIAPLQAGCYQLHFAVRRQPVFDLSVNGQLDLDTLTANDVSVALNADLGQKNLNYLPPELQSLLMQYQVRGKLAANVTGSCPLADVPAGQFVARARISDANVNLAPYRIPVHSLDIDAHSEPGGAVAYNVKLAALDGEANVTGRSAMDSRLDSDLRLALSHMRIEDLLLSAGPTDLAGILNVAAHIKAPLTQVLAHIQPTTQPMRRTALAQLPARWGAGTVELTHARLVKIPLIGKLEQLVGGDSSGARPANERASFAFDLSGDQIRLQDIDYHGPVLMAQGAGTMDLDQRLNVLLGGGPSDSAVGAKLSSTFNRVSNAVARYHVTGTTKDPTINVELADRGTQKTLTKAQDTVENGIQQIGSGLEQAGQGIMAAFKKH